MFRQRKSTLLHVSSRSLWRAIRTDWMTLAGALVLLIAALVALLAPLLAPYDPNERIGELRLAPPGTAGHLLGLDDQGRDVLSRLIWGGRLSLFAAVVPVVIAMSASLAIGLVTGYYRGKLGELVMRFMDVLFAFPAILFALTVSAILGAGLKTIVITIALALVPYMTRIVYGAVVLEREKEYIAASTMLGASRSAILFRELLPNVVSPLLVYAASLIGIMMIFSAGLSLIGLGVQPPNADWGRMTGDGIKVLTQGSPHAALVPGCAILLVSIAANWLGEGLRQQLDPQRASE